MPPTGGSRPATRSASAATSGSPSASRRPSPPGGAGKSEVGAGRLLSPFDLSGRAIVTMGGVSVEDMTTTIGDATIKGSFSWAARADRTRRFARSAPTSTPTGSTSSRSRALAELLGGHDLRDTSTIADSFQIKLTADELLIEQLVMRDVSVDAGFENGGLTVSGIEVGDLGGARFVVTRGQIDDILGEPLGRMEAQLTAQTLTGLAKVVDRLAPETPFARWFRESAPALAPASIALTINSVMDEGRPNSRLDVNGSAKATNFEATIELSGVPTLWRQADLDITASLKSYDAVGVARQIGIDRSEVSVDGGAQFRLTAKGIPDKGLASEVTGSFGGLTLRAAGDAVALVGEPLKFTGTFGIDTADLAPLVSLVGLNIPGTGAALPVSVSGNLAAVGTSADVDWQNGAIAGRQVSGKFRVAEGAEGGLRLENGALELDQLDLGWVASLGLGFAPLPTGIPEEPWPRTPYGEATFDDVTATLDIAAERLLVGDTLQVLNSKFRLGLAPDRVDFDVKSGDALGGTVAGGFSVRNVGGNASLTGNVSLVGGSLDSVVWQRAGRAVATGTLDLSANFEATGRSPAGMLASLTGGGTLAIHKGEARYLNPQAGVLVIRDSDLGQEFTEDALRDLFGSYIDNGNLTFPEVEAPFAIAAGTVRFQNITVEAAESRASGSAAIDLNTMMLDSDWTLTLDSGDDKFGGDIEPQVGIVFRGPLGAPERLLDLLQFNSYLNIRQEARLQEILALEEQARLENAWFNRVKRKLREDEERAARLAEEAKQARIVSATNLEAFHATREVAAEKKAADELIAWWAVAEKTAADKDAAEAAADEAAASARTARAASDAAASEVADLTAAARKVGDDVAAASAASDAAAAARLTAEGNGAAAVATREQAVADADTAAATVEAAGAALAAAIDVRASATTAADAAAAQSDAANRQAEATAAVATDTRDAADASAANAADLAKALASLEAELAAANTALAAASAEAQAKDQVAAALTRSSQEAAAKVEASRPSAEEAAKAAADAEAAYAIAEGALAQAEVTLIAAKAAHGNAMALVEAAQATADADAEAAAESGRLAETARADATKAATNAETTTLDGTTVTVTPAPAAPDATGPAAAADEAEIEAKAKADTAERSRRALASAQSDLEEKAAMLTAAETAVTDARAALADASADASTTRALADQAAQALRAVEMEGSAATTAATDAAAATTAAASVVTERTAARDDLAAEVDAARTAAEEAAAAAAAAEAEATTAANDAAAARSAAEFATREKNAAAEALVAATTAIDTASATLTEAQAGKEAAASVLAEAKTRVAEAEAALADAVATADAARLALDNALAAANQALEDLKVAQAAADAAIDGAVAAEAAAKDAAARAAAMPAGWRPGDRTGSRADAGSAPGDVAAVEAEVVPLLDEPAPAINLVPATPRLRPTRGAAQSEPSAAGLSMPTDGQPLTITQPQ